MTNAHSCAKTLLFLLFSLLATVQSFGQVFVDGVAIDTLNAPYCQLICTNAMPLNRVRVLIDYGQRFVDSGLNRQKIGDANDADIRFNSSIDALNFMAFHGWELVSFAYHEGRFIYLLKRQGKS